MAESFTSQITVDKTIVSLLSRFTYERSFPYALREVISNAYDADATETRIDVDVNAGKVVIFDNGTGMTRTEFDFYLRIAGQKRGKRETPKFGRKRIGQFGVGFLAILPFCESLQITSTTENSEELFTADIPAWKFFKQDGKTIDVGKVEVTGEITRSETVKPQHFTQITLLKFSDIASRYFRAKARTDEKNRISSWPPLQKLKWEMQEDLPLAFPEGCVLNRKVAYNEPIGMEVYLQGAKLQRNCPEGEIIASEEVDVDGVKLKYAIVTNWRGVKPFELQGLKIRLNNVGVGPRTVFNLDAGRSYSRLHWLTGEVQIVSGLDGAITLSRDTFLATPEYEAVNEKLSSVLRKAADNVETIDVAARDMTKHLGGGKQLAVAAKREVLEKNIKTLVDKGFAVRRVDQRGDSRKQPVFVDRTKKEIVVYDEHPGLEDAISVAGKKHRIFYVSKPGSRPSHESACRVNAKGDIEIDAQYPLFRSKRYGDIFKKVFIMATLAKGESRSTASMLDLILSYIEKEFKNF